MNPYTTIRTTGGNTEVTPKPEKGKGLPLQDYLDENLPKPGLPWWAQPGAPGFKDSKGSEMYEELKK